MCQRDVRVPRARVTRKIRRVVKLCRINEDAEHDALIFGASPGEERFVPRVQRAHRGHKTHGEPGPLRRATERAPFSKVSANFHQASTSSRAGKRAPRTSRENALTASRTSPCPSA